MLLCYTIHEIDFAAAEATSGQQTAAVLPHVGKGVGLFCSQKHAINSMLLLYDEWL